jgi:hypothetical protein
LNVALTILAFAEIDIKIADKANETRKLVFFDILLPVVWPLQHEL